MATRVEGEVTKAQAAMARQDWDEAIRHYGKAIRSWRHGESGVRVSGQQGIQLVPMRAFLYSSRGTAFAHKGDYRTALADYDEALECEPTSVYCLDNRARMHHKMGDYERAVRGYSQALSLLPVSDARAAQLYVYRADAYREWGQPELALKDLRDAAEQCRDETLRATIDQLKQELLPNDRGVLAAKKKCVQCGEVLEMLRFRCPKCSSEMFDVIATGSDHELVEVMQGRQKLSQQHVDQGGRLFQQGLADEALKEFQQAIEANPWNATAHGNVGVIFLRRGQRREALEWFERALEIDPNVPGVKDMVTQVQRQLR